MTDFDTSYPVKKTKSGKYVIEAYDAFYPLMDDLSLELLLYRKHLFGDHQDAEKCLWHLKNAHHLAWPQYAKTWTDWDEMCFQAHVLPENEWIGYAGPGGTGKSHRCARLANLFFWSAPRTCRVGITSTTKDSAGARAWGYVQKLTDEAKKRWSWINLAHKSSPEVYYWGDSPLNLQYCIILAPVLTGGADKEARTLSTLIGVHPEDGYLMIVDECNFMPTGMFGVFANAESGTRWFQAHALANPIDRYDVHGIMCQPDPVREGGWTGSDLRKRKQWFTQRGTCIYLNPFDSPAIHHSDPEVKKFYTDIKFPTLASLKKKARDLGETSVEYWSQALGLWPPESGEAVVLSKELMNTHKVFDKPEWQPVGTPVKLAVIDPAFSVKGGDSCILQIGELGYTTAGYWTLAATKRYDIKREAGTGIDPFVQVARQAIEICKKEDILPENFAVEAHGTGMGLPSNIEFFWSDKFLRIDGSRMASEDIVDSQSGAKAKDLYGNKVTEMWMNVKKLAVAGQLKGMPEDAAIQFSLRKYAGPPEKTKMTLETKLEFKTRLGRVPGMGANKSPDEADAMSCLVELAIRRHGWKVESPQIVSNRVAEWNSDPFFHDRIDKINKMWNERKIRDQLSSQFGLLDPNAPVNKPNFTQNSYKKRKSPRKMRGYKKMDS